MDEGPGAPGYSTVPGYLTLEGAYLEAGFTCVTCKSRRERILPPQDRNEELSSQLG